MQELGSGDTRHRPIALGGALVTVVEPRRGHEVEYNRWYERDHFYAGCMIGAWTIQGGRYVATRDLKQLRYPVENDVIPDPTSGSYMAIYWILAGKFNEWMEWGTAQVKWLHENGRMFAERDHIHTVMYKYRSRYELEDGVPVELALDHRSPYCVLFVGEPLEGIGLDDIDGFLAALRAPLRGGRRVHAGAAARRRTERRAPQRRRPSLHGAVVRRRRPAQDLERDLRAPRSRPRGRRDRDHEVLRPVPRHRGRHRHVHRPALVTPVCAFFGAIRRKTRKRWASGIAVRAAWSAM